MPQDHKNDFDDKTITRFTAPTKYDAAPYGTLCIVIVDTNSDFRESAEKLYLQTSADEANPHWISVASLLEEIFSKSFKNSIFCKKMLELFKQIDEDRNIEITHHDHVFLIKSSDD